jgi:hypothetical protein
MVLFKKGHRVTLGWMEARVEVANSLPESRRHTKGEQRFMASELFIFILFYFFCGARD